jgi:hypothetical protein
MGHWEIDTLVGGGETDRRSAACGELPSSEVNTWNHRNPTTAHAGIA